LALLLDIPKARARNDLIIKGHANLLDWISASGEPSTGTGMTVTPAVEQRKPFELQPLLEPLVFPS
jgi:hypothetical protein